jgi:hypothetical protein
MLDTGFWMLVEEAVFRGEIFPVLIAYSLIDSFYVPFLPIE